MLNPFKQGSSLLDQAMPIAQLLSQVQELVSSAGGGLEMLKRGRDGGGGKVVGEADGEEE
jgi:hypothetical protein